MVEAKGVPKFVYDFFLDSTLKLGFVSRQSVELVLEPRRGDNGTRAVQLRFAEDKRQYGNEQVHIDESQNLSLPVDVSVPLEVFKNCRGVVLCTRRVERALNWWGDSYPLDRCVEFARNGEHDPGASLLIKERAVKFNVQTHFGRFSPYFSILL